MIPARVQHLNTTPSYNAAILDPNSTAATSKPQNPIVTPNMSSDKKQLLTHKMIPIAKTPPNNPYKSNIKPTQHNKGSNNYPKINTRDQFYLHKNNLDYIKHTDIQTPTHHLSSSIQTSKDLAIKIQNLTPDLEPLGTVIMLQHNALSQHIIELGTICLNCTQTMEKKKNSSSKLINEGNIPRSLRITCDLMTSPDFENDSNYLILNTKCSCTLYQNWTRDHARMVKDQYRPPYQG